MKAAAAASVQQAGSEAEHAASGRPAAYLQRRLHCRVALSATRPPSPVRDNVPVGPAAGDRGTADSDEVIVIGSGWTSDARRAATKFQPKLEPGSHPFSVPAESYIPATQLTTVEQPRRDVATTHHRSVNWSSRPAHAEPSTTNFDQSTAVRSDASAPRTQPQTLAEPHQNNELVVKRGRGRPRKYPPKPTAGKHQIKSTKDDAAVKVAAITRLQHLTNDAMHDRLTCDKENISPRSSAVAELERNIWTSNVVRDAACTSKSLMVNKFVGLSERQKLAQLPVNVIVSDDKNNFQKKPTDKMTPNFRLKDFDKDKLLSMWNTLKGTRQSDDHNADSRKDQVGDSTEQRLVTTEVIGEKRHENFENCTTEHQRRPNEVLQTPMLEAEPPTDSQVPCQQSAAKTVHWKRPEIDGVGQSNNKIPSIKCFDEASAGDAPKTSFPFVDDFDDKLPLSESLGKPLFTSTPIKLSDTATSARSTVVRGKRARVRFRPVTQTGDDDEEDGSDRVELSKLAALPSMQQGVKCGATQISGVRPADIVRAFRTIDNVAAAATSLALQPHATSHALPFAVPSQTNVRTPTDIYRPPLVNRVISASQPEHPVVTEVSSPATMTSTPSSDADSPPSSELVPGQLLHFYGAHYDRPPYNLSPSTGGFVTKAARKRPISDDVEAADRKRFQPDVPVTAATAVSAGHVAEDIGAPASAKQSATAAELSQPEMHRPAAASQYRPVAEMRSCDAGREVRRAPNGVPVDELLRLQHKLSTVGDATTLRRVVQIIGETGRYLVNDVTFDFDLCNLDSTTVARLVQCVDAAAVMS